MRRREVIAMGTTSMGGWVYEITFTPTVFINSGWSVQKRAVTLDFPGAAGVGWAKVLTQNFFW